MKQLFVIVLPLFLLGGEDFISQYEYGEMLYHNPRGISCAQCHGDSGEGKVIVSLEEKKIYGPDIRNESLEKMLSSINSYHNIMPRYYLTKEEMEKIFYFIQQKRAFEEDRE